MNSSSLTKLTIIELFLLFVQFSIGMWNNLFALIPLGSPFKFFTYAGGVEVLAHITVGSLILIVGSTLIWVSYKTRNSLAVELSALSVAFILSAIVNGVLFLEIFSIPSLYNVDNYFSLAMALSFLAAFTLLFSELYLTKKTEKA